MKLRFILVLLLVLTIGLILGQGQSLASSPSGHEAATAVTSTEQGGEHGTEAAHGGGGEEGGHHGPNLGKVLPIWSALPFIGILLSIALFPLFAPEFWHHHFSKVSAAWALIFAVPFLFAYGGNAWYEIVHIYLIDYFPFIILLWALFTVAGGILVRGNMAGKPIVNTGILLIGTILASWMGTTGAAMLLIRPIIKANKARKSKVHTIIFFIFLVANIGGSLTPLGDPPLFLGFIHGVPFFWTFKILPHMILVSLMVLSLYFIADTIIFKRELQKGNPEWDAQLKEEKVPLRLVGAHNFIFLVGVIGGVLMSGMVKLGAISVMGVHVELQNLLRDGILIFMGILSLKFTPWSLREENGFTWFAIKEVAYLFAGIFMTIIPALAMLKAGTEGPLAFIINAVKEPFHYFWVTGILSSFLDNAPTYLTFLNTALGNFFAGMPEPQAVSSLIAEKEIYLKAISAGAVFFGAVTYIGNAPNFMVKSIAEENDIPMPSFLGYMFYSAIILLPLFLIVTLVFF
jgi:Na+/H+ antiporter NhaD/arsenite permease-like protein